MLTDLNELNERWFQAWLDKDAASVEGCHGLGETRGRMATRDGAVLLQQRIVASRSAHY